MLKQSPATIASEWATFSKDLMHLDDGVIEAARTTFYSGATAGFTLMRRALFETPNAAEADAIIEGVQGELKAFLDEIRQRAIREVH